MNLPQLNALVFCLNAVYAEPWWNLIGEFDELVIRPPADAQFDAFLKFGDTPKGRDTEIELRIVDPQTGQPIERFPAMIRGDGEGIATRAVAVALSFSREDVYQVEVVVAGHLVAVRKLPVVDVG